MKERLCVEEQLFRADVEERLFRAVSASAFDCGLQPRPALKGIHHPAVAAMNGRSSTLTQALVLRARRNIQTEGNPGTAQVRGTPPLCPNVNARLCVEEQLFRADVEERLFRAALACAFDCGLQPRPALKGIHPPAVAAMNGRSSTLTQALVLRARRNTRQEETQVRHRFVVPTLVSPTPGETKKWGSLSLFRFRKRWASPPSRNTQVPDNPLYPCHSEGDFRPEESAFAPNCVPAADATPPDTPRVYAAPCRPA